MKITEDIWEAGMSRNGGWNGKQLRVLCIKTLFNKGWKKKLWNKEFTEEQIQEFLYLKDKHLPDLKLLEKSKKNKHQLDF